MIHDRHERVGQHLLLGRGRVPAAKQRLGLRVALEEDLVEPMHELGLALDHQVEAAAQELNVEGHVDLLGGTSC
jgi:hypothetical protein